MSSMNFASRGETNASDSTNFERESAHKKTLANIQPKQRISSQMNLNTERARMTSGYYNILAHDNTKEYQDSQRQNKILNEIKGNYQISDQHQFALHYLTQRQNYGGMTPDNNIVFINRDTIVRRPREFKTPPPPIYGQEEEYVPDPRERFYDPYKDPNTNKFNFLDNRDASVSKHYQTYLKSKTL